MKLKLLKFIYQLSPLFDVFLSILIIPGALMMLYFRRLGAKNYPLTSKVLKRIGVFPIRKHFDEPFFGELSEIHKSLNKKRDLPGIKLRENYQKLNLKKLIFENKSVFKMVR